MNKDTKFPIKINGIWFKTEEEYKARVQSDIDAFAQLLFDIYSDKMKLEKLNNAKD